MDISSTTEMHRYAPKFSEVPYGDMKTFLKEKLSERQLAAEKHDEDVGEHPFCVADLSVLHKQLKLWKEELPTVKPFYAVKCNDDIEVLKVLAGFGIGFDCASKLEIERVLSLGVTPDRIIYANPCKQVSFVRYAAKVKVFLMTFDNIPELHKIKKHCPDAKLVLRVLPPATEKVQCELGNKFGCHPDASKKLLTHAKELGLNVAGVSFHVGSGCYDLDVFGAAVRLSARVFEEARELGFHPWLLDIGGGFPGSDGGKVTFSEICASLRPALGDYFPPSEGVEIIAEPGRFFVASAFTLATCVIAVRDAKCDTDTVNGNNDSLRMYYLNDGVYGSFNCLLYDHAEVEPSCLTEPADQELENCSVWGPTCDGLDVIRERALLPRLHVGDWVMFKDMGAYTLVAGGTFNGMPRPDTYHVWMNAEEAPPPSIWLLHAPGIVEPKRKRLSESFTNNKSSASIPAEPTTFVGSGGVLGQVKPVAFPSYGAGILHEMFPIMSQLAVLNQPASQLSED